MQTFLSELSKIVGVKVGNISIKISENSRQHFYLDFIQGIVTVRLSFDTFEPLSKDRFGSLVVTNFRKENPFSPYTIYHYEAVLCYGKETKQIMKSIGEFF